MKTLKIKVKIRGIVKRKKNISGNRQRHDQSRPTRGWRCYWLAKDHWEKVDQGSLGFFFLTSFSLPIFKTHDNFFLRGKGKGELRIDAKFTSSKALMSAYLQEVPNTPVSINHSLLHITFTLNLIWWAIFLTISKSLGDLATAQYRVPAYFSSHSDCQVFAIFIDTRSQNLVFEHRT